MQLLYRPVLVFFQTNWDWAACTGCWLPNTLHDYLVITLRGLCARSKFDTDYRVGRGEDGRLLYHGRKQTTALYKPNDRQWELRLATNPAVRAVTNASLESLLMGKHHWTVYNDFDCTGEQGDVALSLTTCTEGRFPPTIAHRIF